MGILQKIIRNDAMRTDPHEIYNWRVFALATAAYFGGTFFGMDIGIIGGVLTMPSRTEEERTGACSSEAENGPINRARALLSAF
ncbi:hypothetical protein LTR70_008578 [Exophiala xenobiotica]|nr:hypothetical protein LTR70_008578 [Exophiala xenobiotica]